jgi:hypothetical protein
MEWNSNLGNPSRISVTTVDAWTAEKLFAPRGTATKDPETYANTEERFTGRGSCSRKNATLASVLHRERLIVHEKHVHEGATNSTQL